MKKPVPFLWRYLPWQLLLLIAALTTVGVYSSFTLRHTYMDRITQELTVRSRLVSAIVLDDLKEHRYAAIQSSLDSLGTVMSGRFTVILPDGRVVGDSRESPQKMENHSDRPEIIAALRDGIGISTRFSNTLKLSMVYVALPCRIQGSATAVIRSALPLTRLTDALHALYRRLVMVLAGVILGSGLIAFIISNIIKKPITGLIEGFGRFSRGDLDYRIHISDPQEFMQLGRAMNSMAAELKKIISSMKEQQQEINTVLAGMSEALITVDKEGRIVRFNPAAAALLETGPAAAEGRTLAEVIRNMDLMRFIHSIREDAEADEQETVIRFAGDRFLQARGRVLPGVRDGAAQTLLVLTDITRIKRLEKIRREFVANVSHELKTPITAISAAVDTLADGALSDSKNSERFLAMIAKHTERLHAIVEDLLQLSRLENISQIQETTNALEPLPVEPVIQEAVSLCRTAAARKQITLEMQCAAAVSARMHAPSLEQALVNLIDNAIKYSPEGSTVVITCKENADGAVISVSDAGEGIPREHQERIFERFYRVDKSRSREQGGTGLGLAIVKHAVLAQGGTVRVESEPFKGSVFTITLPANALRK